MGGCLERPLSVYGPLCVQASVPGRSSYLLKQAKFQSWFGAWGPGVGPHIVGLLLNYPAQPQAIQANHRVQKPPDFSSIYILPPPKRI